MTIATYWISRQLGPKTVSATRFGWGNPQILHELFISVGNITHTNRPRADNAQQVETVKHVLNKTFLILMPKYINNCTY